VVVERGEERKRELLEVCAAGSRGRHGAGCLGASEVAGSRRCGEARKAVGVNHHSLNWVAWRLFHELFRPVWG
jgi:hypothetical protein